MWKKFFTKHRKSKSRSGQADSSSGQEHLPWTPRNERAQAIPAHASAERRLQYIQQQLDTFGPSSVILGKYTVLGPYPNRIAGGVFQKTLHITALSSVSREPILLKSPYKNLFVRSQEVEWRCAGSMISAWAEVQHVCAQQNFALAGEGVVQFCLKFTGTGVEHVAIKFFAKVESYKEEVALYQNRSFESFMPLLLEHSDNTSGSHTDAFHDPLPPYIVMEKGTSLLSGQSFMRDKFNAINVRFRQGERPA